ncbi:hypothetical protein B0T17DRAFT_511079 [Bombardia bombarda]|uniref:Uncharacterized protein n=1 Tax=Bombardia bombarda TaxID=252184 RepID=A0AA40BVM1_9PEZI|nr:hypothetical protein B0T17DRAFT_511079 [Bombardia bombarda]
MPATISAEVPIQTRAHTNTTLRPFVYSIEVDSNNYDDSWWAVCHATAKASSTTFDMNTGPMANVIKGKSTSKIYLVWDGVGFEQEGRYMLEIQAKNMTTGEKRKRTQEMVTVTKRDPTSKTDALVPGVETLCPEEERVYGLLRIALPTAGMVSAAPKEFLVKEA